MAKNYTVSINNGSVTLIAAQSNIVSENKFSGCIRRILSLTNTEAAGGSTIYISVGQEAAVNKGIVLLPGQTFIWSIDAGYSPPLAQVNAYSTGTPTIAIYEEIGWAD